MRPALLSTHCSVVFVRHIIEVSRARMALKQKHGGPSASESRSCLLLVSKLSLRVYELLFAHFLRYLDLTGVHSNILDYMFVDRLRRLKISVKYHAKTLEFLLKKLPIMASLEEIEITVSGRAETELIRRPKEQGSSVRLHLSSLRNVRRLALAGSTSLWDHVVMGVAEGSKEKLIEVTIPSIGHPETLDFLADCPNLRDVRCEEYEPEDGYDYVDVHVLSEVSSDTVRPAQPPRPLRLGLEHLKLPSDDDESSSTSHRHFEDADELSLKVQRSTRTDTGEMLGRMQKLRNLYLNFYDSDNFGVSSVLSTARTLPFLTNLTIEDARDCDLKLITSTCPNLAALSLISCRLYNRLESPAGNQDSAHRQPPSSTTLGLGKSAPEKLVSFVLYDCTCRRSVLLSFLGTLRQVETLILVDVCDECDAATIDLFPLIDEVLKTNPMGQVDRLKLGDAAEDVKLPLVLGSKFESLALLEWEGNWSWEECRQAEIQSIYALSLPAVRLHSTKTRCD